MGDVGEPEAMVAGVAAEPVERLGEIHTGTFGDDALGLLDDHPAVECHLQLLGPSLEFPLRGLAGVVEGQGDPGGPGEGLHDLQLVGTEGVPTGERAHEEVAEGAGPGDDRTTIAGPRPSRRPSSMAATAVRSSTTRLAPLAMTSACQVPGG